MGRESETHTAEAARPSPPLSVAQPSPLSLFSPSGHLFPSSLFANTEGEKNDSIGGSVDFNGKDGPSTNEDASRAISKEEN